MGSGTQFMAVDTDKMKHRGIRKGDLVVVAPEEPAPGDIGVSGAIGQGELKEVKEKGNWRGKVVFVVREV